MKGIDLSMIPSKGVNLNLARWSNAFGAKGKGSRKGVERGRLKPRGDRVSCTWEAAFDEFGHNRFEIESSVVVKGTKVSLESTDWRDNPRNAIVSGKVSGTKSKPTWTYDVMGPQGHDSVFVPLAKDALPVVFQRFLPLLMERQAGATVSFSSLPEDAFPWWRPQSKASFFPLDEAPSRKEVRCIGVDTLKRGRDEMSGWTFEQHGDSGLEHWWMVSESGQFLAMAWKKTLWLPEDATVVKNELADRP